MNGINDILKNRKFEVSTTRGVNNMWEEAKEFCEYIGIGNDRKTIVGILGLCKRYGKGKVYGLRSNLKDAKFDKYRINGLIVHLLTMKDPNPLPSPMNNDNTKAR